MSILVLSIHLCWVSNLIITAVLIGFSSVAFLLAAWRYRHLHIKVSHLEVEAVPLAMIRSFSLLLVCCSMIALAGLWYMTVTGYRTF